MRAFYGILLTSGLVVTACGTEALEPAFQATVDTDESSYALDDTIEVSVTNAADDEDLVVLTCGDGETPLYSIERRNGTLWEAYNGSVCLPPTVQRLMLDPGETVVREVAVATVIEQEGTYRIGVFVHAADLDPEAEVRPTFSAPFTIE